MINTNEQKSMDTLEIGSFEWLQESKRLAWKELNGKLKYYSSIYDRQYKKEMKEWEDEKKVMKKNEK